MKNETLVWKSGYTAFGIKAGETTNLIDFDGLYTGCDFDAETGLTYHWNRWLSMEISCYLSVVIKKFDEELSFTILPEHIDLFNKLHCKIDFDYYDMTS